MTRLLATLPPTFRAERRWVLGVVADLAGIRLEFLEGDGDAIRIHRGDGRGVIELVDALFHGPDRSLIDPASLPPVPVAEWDAGRDLPEASLVESAVPVLYGSPDERGDWVTGLGTERLRVRADLLGGAFFLLSRLEEALQTPMDGHGRMPAMHSVAHRAGFLDRPIVNEYAELLRALAERMWPGVTHPRTRGYRLVLSHDVDLPFCRERRPRRVVGDLIERRDPDLAARRAMSMLRRCADDERADVCFTFDRIMDLAERQGLRTSFNFLCGGVGGPNNGSYTLGDLRVRRLLRRIADRSHEIGLHPSYATHDDAQAIAEEFRALRDACERAGIRQESWGGRQHYLRWRNPATWTHWDAAGLDYDSTLGFADRPGFRCGVCTPFRVFDLGRRAELGLVERPLVAMDVTLFQYLGLGPEEALEDIRKLSQRCRTVHGEFTLLWHNDQLISRRISRVFEAAIAVAS